MGQRNPKKVINLIILFCILLILFSLDGYVFENCSFIHLKFIHSYTRDYLEI